MLHTLVPFRRSQPARFGLYDELDSVFDAFFRGLGTPAGGGAPSAFAPRMDVSENEKEYRIDVELPGLEQKDIAVTLENGVLAITGERKEEKEAKDEKRGLSHRESWRGTFQRVLRLPEDADEKGVTAATKSGILTVVVPKLPKPEAQVRTIPVQAS
jgi:HSP20 family protein